MKSLRRRLLWGTGVATVILVLVFGVLFDRTLEQSLRQDLDAELEGEFERLAENVFVGFPSRVQLRATALGVQADPTIDDGPAAERERAQTRLLALADKYLELEVRTRGSLGRPWQIVDSTGRAVAGSRAFDWEAIESALVPGIHDVNGYRVLVRVRENVPFEEPGWQAAWNRIRGERTVPRQRATFYVAIATDRIDESLSRFRSMLAVGGALLLAFLLLAVRLVIRRALAPLGRLEREVAALDATHLDKRIQSEGVPRELRALTEQLNAALERIAASFARERRIAASLAHELRTPLAELRSAVDQANRWPDDNEVRTEHLSITDEATQHMQRVVAAMLRLARIQSGQEAPAFAATDLVVCFEHARSVLAELIRGRGHTLDVQAPTSLVLETDGEMVEVVLRTLLQNAVEHAPRKSTIRVAIEAFEGGARVRIENPADGLSATDLERVTEPFWRGDAARHGDTGGGLGGSIAAALLDTLGGGLDYALDGDGQLRVEVRLQASATTQA